jgi:hypothetical protein
MMSQEDFATEDWLSELEQMAAQEAEQQSFAINHAKVRRAHLVWMLSAFCLFSNRL